MGMADWPPNWRLKMKPKYWAGEVKARDDFNFLIETEFVDGKTTFGSWAIMSPQAFGFHGLGIGPGYGQRYQKQADGRWLKVEG